MQTATKEKLFGGAGTALIVGGLGYALVLGFDVHIQQRVQDVIALLDLKAPPPPPKIEERHVFKPTLSKPSGKASPANLRNKAAEIEAPKPMPIPLPPPPLIAAAKPAQGAAAQSGASDHPGAGQGAGGVGTGTGSGGYGNGEGSGGDIAPRKTKGYLTYSDIPDSLRQTDFDVTVWVRYVVETDGHVDNCRVTNSSGRPEVDAITCRLIEQRFRYKPSKMFDGTPVRSIVVEKHEWVNEVQVEPAKG